MSDKACKLCGEVKSIELFSLNGKYRHSYCRPCEVSYKKSRRQADRTTAQFRKVRDRAKQNGIEFNLELDDIVIPDTCPVLGIPISRDGNMENWPSLDRINPEAGYTKDNVIVVSFLANRIKNNATVEQLGKVYNFYEQIHSRSASAACNSQNLQ